jgi:hypothetical protein
MTYLADGEQYVAILARGDLLAFALGKPVAASTTAVPQ